MRQESEVVTSGRAEGRSVAGYGWMRDVPDPRDLVYAAGRDGLAALPVRVDLRPHCPPVYHQRELGSAPVQAVAAALEYDFARQQQAATTPSRLFLYHNARVLAGMAGVDAGVSLRDVLRSVVKHGICPERLWPQVTDRVLTRPTAVCYSSAWHAQVRSYLRLPPQLIQLKACLAEGHPFVFGFTAFASLESEAVSVSGVVPLPDPMREPVVGAHAVMAVGYDDRAQMFIVRNSWGRTWGDEGYGYLPYVYVMDSQLAADFWTLRRVEHPACPVPVRRGRPNDLLALRTVPTGDEGRRTVARHVVGSVLGPLLRLPDPHTDPAGLEHCALSHNRAVQSLPPAEAAALLREVSRRLPWTPHWLFELPQYPTVGDLVRDALT